MLEQLGAFADVYERRPFKDNAGGMSSAHLFHFWFLMRQLQPGAIIESGVWRGLGTWFIEQACPQAEIYCIDINWKNLCYRSSRATYLSEDIARHDWSSLPAESLVLFDDHVNAVDRFRLSVQRGFRHVIFEDNYPPGRGDCYSIKQALAHAGHRAPGFKASIKRLIGRARAVAANAADAEYILANADVIELPPIFKRANTRWGDPWDDRYPTPEPLLRKVAMPYQQVYFDEADGYTWICYARLKSSADSRRNGTAVR